MGESGSNTSITEQELLKRAKGMADSITLVSQARTLTKSEKNGVIQQVNKP